MTAAPRIEHRLLWALALAMRSISLSSGPFTLKDLSGAQLETHSSVKRTCVRIADPTSATHQHKHTGGRVPFNCLLTSAPPPR